MDSITVRALLVRGMVSGVAAGLLAFGLAYVIGEPGLDAGIAYEDAHTQEHSMELVSRTMQSTAGLATAVLVFGTAVGGLAAVVFCVALGRIGQFSARATAALVAAAALTTTCLVPFLKYPANPPGSSDPATIDTRTTLYFGMVALSVLVAFFALTLGQRLADRVGNWNAAIAATVVFIAAITAVMAFLPPVNETPRDFPAPVLWQFRIAAIGIQTLLWAAFGAIFGYLAERVLQPHHRRPVHG